MFHRKRFHFPTSTWTTAHLFQQHKDHSLSEKLWKVTNLTHFLLEDEKNPIMISEEIIKFFDIA